MDVAQEPSLRDALAANLDIVEQGGNLNAPQPSATPAPAENAPGAEPAPGETSEQKSDRLANRARDDKGRLLPGTKEPDPATTTMAVAPAKNAAPQVPGSASAGGATLLAPVAPAGAAPKPTWWKGGEVEKDWATLPPSVQQEILRRESNYASGVSAYRQEAEAARPLSDAIAPFLPNLQRFNLEPAQAVHNLLAAHERLTLGTPQEKLALGAQIIRDYQIDPQALVQILTGQAQAPVIAPPQQRAQKPVDVRAEVQSILIQEKAANAHQQFLADVPTKYPHYETVKDDMAGLLQLGKAQDYESAYRMAIRLHDDLWEAEQQAKTQQAEQQRIAAQQATVNRAKANTVSVKSATPSGPVATKKPNDSLRGELEANFDEITASRV